MTFQFTGTDTMNSVLNQLAADGQSQQQSFSPYGGSSTALAHTPGFNGERCDPLTGTTHLGNGYRAYNPTLLCFHCPDSMSPFGAGGINPYAYCAGDPVNKSDPSGHMSAQAGVGIGLGVLGLVMGTATFGVSIAAKVAVVASVAAISTGIASIATESSNPEASAALGWASTSAGVIGMIGVGTMTYQRPNIPNGAEGGDIQKGEHICSPGGGSH
ncbi:RHS repeat-associated core domain-containing protein [Serratia quinivorans]|uniref:RHS repeat-associated core domain-containing protein n=1 Tax=Serratia quinivorans TaxID=137545 RepID=UPI002177B667|nr:RHS repeat-associated core domain-containing protein [Serratia quinivorans]CAI0912668.1 RHS repeat-associated core domain [Serratia quinivorans]CAI1533857.1 RHS repeat-associated core domain [Serratia quinivorans]